MRRPARTASTSDGKAIVEQDDRCRLAGDVGAALAHRHADVGGAQRRPVVDAVAGHRDDLAAALQCLDDAKLLRRHDAGEDADGRDGLLALRLAHRVELGAGQDRAVARADQPGLARDRQGRRRRVAGDHDDADAGAPALGDRRGTSSRSGSSKATRPTRLPAGRRARRAVARRARPRRRSPAVPRRPRPRPAGRVLASARPDRRSARAPPRARP